MKIRRIYTLMNGVQVSHEIDTEKVLPVEELLFTDKTVLTLTKDNNGVTIHIVSRNIQTIEDRELKD